MENCTGQWTKGGYRSGDYAYVEFACSPDRYVDAVPEEVIVLAIGCKVPNFDDTGRRCARMLVSTYFEKCKMGM